MIADNPPLGLPPSVSAYLTDRAIQTAVDSLLQIKVGSMPPGLAVSELDDYLPARAAAELTRYEYAQALQRLWQNLWGGKIAPKWLAPDVDALISAGQVVTVEAMWDDKWFSLYHELGGLTLYTFVEFDPKSVSIGYSLENNDGPLFREGDAPFRWHADGYYEGWFVATWQMPITSAEFDWPALHHAASEALKRVEAHLHG